MSELAQKINVSVRTVERIENNEMHISEKMNKKIEEHIKYAKIYLYHRFN